MSIDEKNGDTLRAVLTDFFEVFDVWVDEKDLSAQTAFF